MRITSGIKDLLARVRWCNRFGHEFIDHKCIFCNEKEYSFSRKVSNGVSSVQRLRLGTK